MLKQVEKAFWVVLVSTNSTLQESHCWAQGTIWSFFLVGTCFCGKVLKPQTLTLDFKSGESLSPSLEWKKTPPFMPTRASSRKGKDKRGLQQYPDYALQREV